MSPRKPSKPPHRHQERPDDRPNQGRPTEVLPTIAIVTLAGRALKQNYHAGPQVFRGWRWGYWLFGHHAAEEAFRNSQPPNSSAPGLRRRPCGTRSRHRHAEVVERDVIDKLVGRDVVHQGIAARVSPLPEVDIYEICDLARDTSRCRDRHPRPGDGSP